MAWQLIYTSAPRLLEAGRSGFGTVARHRAIHPILASALERDSQFDRSAVRGRVVFAHRIVAAGGSRFHVLSCIRETGADYTGRTNHIAHHLIIDPRELSALGSAAPTPVDICRGMSWRTAWPDAPKWLEGGDEIALAQCHSDTTPGGAWQAIAGDARYAGVLRPATSSVLIVPPDADALALFAESLTVAAAQAWQATFNNCIQPTDDLSEFRWIAVEAASALRERAVGGRTVLDLTAPETLPAPPESRSKLFIPAPDALLPAPSSLAPKSAKPVGNLFDAQLAAHAPRPQQERRKKGGLFVYIALAAVLAGAAIYCGMTLFAEAPELTAQRTKVREEVNAAFPGTGMETAQSLSQVSREQLPAALALASAAHEAHEALKKQSLPSISAEEARGKAKAVSLNIPQPIARIFDLYSTHFKFQQRQEKLRNSAPAASQLGELASLWNAADQATENLTDPQAKQLRERAMKNVEALWAERSLAVLKTDAPPAENADWFHKQFASHPPILAESQSAKAARKLIEDWRAVDAAGDDKKKLQSLIAEGRDAWPAWLKAKAEGQIANTPNQAGKPVIPPTDAPKQENVAGGSASKPFEGELILVTNPTAPEEWAEFAKELAAGACTISLGQNPKSLSEQKGKYRIALNEADAAFTSDASGFHADKAAPPSPYELRLVKAGKTVITAWVSDGKKPFLTREKGLARAGDEIQVKDSLAASLCQLAQRRGWALTLASADWSAAMVADGKASIAPKVEALKKDIEKLRASRDLLEKIRDGKAFPVNLEAAIKDMAKYANEAGFPRPEDDAKIKEQYKDEKQKANRDKALADNERLRNAIERPSPNDPVSLGFFIHLASNRPVNSDALSEIGKKMEHEKPKLGSEKFDGYVVNALSGIRESEKALSVRTQIKSYSNDKEKQQRERDRNEAKRDLDMVQRLEAFLVAIQALPATRESAKAEIPKTLQEIDSRLKHPLLHAELPPGDYTISVKPPASANPLPFIHFNISKPQ